MELKNINIKPEGLKVLVDFLHSEKNIITPNTVESTQWHRFYIQNMIPIKGKSEIVGYNVEIGTICNDGEVKEMFDVLKEIYTK